MIIIGGGWVPLLYYHYLLADKSREPIRTRDIDLLAEIQVPMVGDQTVDRLLLEAGFKATFKSPDTPPVIHYEGTIDDFRIGGEYHPLSVKVPSPEAYIFHKGLVFERRKDKQKKAKALY